MDEDEFYRQAIRREMERQNITVNGLAKATDISEAGLRAILNGGVASTTADKLRRIARALNVPVTKFFSEEGGAVAKRKAAWNDDVLPAHLLPIRGAVQAGIWVEEDTPDFNETHETIPVAEDARFPGHDQFALKIRGDSINEYIADGEYAVCVDVATIRDWQAEDLVVVERRRGGGALRETTVKQVKITPDGRLQLWPRSKNPKFKEPIVLDDVEDEDMQIELKGLVIGKYSPLFGK